MLERGGGREVLTIFQYIHVSEPVNSNKTGTISMGMFT